MNYKMRMLMKCIGTITALAVGSASCFSSPTTAHVINEEVLSIQLEQSDGISTIQSNFLIEGGQTILLNEDFSEMVIPITVSSSAVSLARGESVTAAITAETSDENRIRASLDIEEFFLQESNQTINLTLNRLDYVQTDTSETDMTAEETETEESETEETEKLEEIIEPEMIEEQENIESETRIMPYTITGTAAITNPEEEATDSEPEVTDPEPEVTAPETEVTDPEPEVTEPETEVTEPETEVTEPETEVTDSETEVTDPETEATTEEENIEDTPLTAEIELVVGEKVFSATFVINEESEEEEILGDLQYCPSQYHPTGVIELINNQETETVIGKFPAMTSYIIDREKFLLYDGGNIKLSAGAKIKLDFSNTELAQDLAFCSGGGTDYTITYTDTPYKTNTAQLLIIQEKEKSLPVSYKWGAIEPIVIIEQLTVEDDELKWIAVETITHSQDENGNIKVIPNYPEAGTYRVKALWIESEITLYQVEISFYVQYGSADQGGNG